MSEVALGYYVERWIEIGLFALQTVLFLVLTVSENSHGRKEPAWTIKWTAHRIGPVASLLMVAASVDSNQALGIYTTSNGGIGLTLANSVNLILILSYSSCYSIMLCNYVILRKKPPGYLSWLYVVPAFGVVVLSNSLVGYSMATDTAVYTGVYALVIAVSFAYGCICFHVAVNPLIRMLRDTHATTSSFRFQGSENHTTQKAVRTLAMFRWANSVCSVAACLLLGLFASNGLQAPVAEPAKYNATLFVTFILIWAGLDVILWFVWEKPGSAADSPAGRTRTHSFHTRNRTSSHGGRHSRNPSGVNDDPGASGATTMQSMSPTMGSSTTQESEAGALSGNALSLLGSAAASASASEPVAQTLIDPDNELLEPSAGSPPPASVAVRGDVRVDVRAALAAGGVLTGAYRARTTRGGAPFVAPISAGRMAPSPAASLRNTPTRARPPYRHTLHTRASSTGGGGSGSGSGSGSGGRGSGSGSGVRFYHHHHHRTATPPSARDSPASSPVKRAGGYRLVSPTGHDSAFASAASSPPAAAAAAASSAVPPSFVRTSSLDSVASVASVTSEEGDAKVGLTSSVELQARRSQVSADGSVVLDVAPEFAPLLVSRQEQPEQYDVSLRLPARAPLLLSSLSSSSSSSWDAFSPSASVSALSSPSAALHHFVIEERDEEEEEEHAEEEEPEEPELDQAEQDDQQEDAVAVAVAEAAEAAEAAVADDDDAALSPHMGVQAAAAGQPSLSTHTAAAAAASVAVLVESPQSTRTTTTTATSSSPGSSMSSPHRLEADALLASPYGSASSATTSAHNSPHSFLGHDHDHDHMSPSPSPSPSPLSPRVQYLPSPTSTATVTATSQALRSLFSLSPSSRTATSTQSKTAPAGATATAIITAATVAAAIRKAPLVIHAVPAAQLAPEPDPDPESDPHAVVKLHPAAPPLHLPDPAHAPPDPRSEGDARDAPEEEAEEAARPPLPPHKFLFVRTGTDSEIRTQRAWTIEDDRDETDVDEMMIELRSPLSTRHLSPSFGAHHHVSHPHAHHSTRPPLPHTSRGRRALPPAHPRSQPGSRSQSQSRTALPMPMGPPAAVLLRSRAPAGSHVNHAEDSEAEEDLDADLGADADADADLSSVDDYELREAVTLTRGGSSSGGGSQPPSAPPSLHHQWSTFSFSSAHSLDSARSSQSAQSARSARSVLSARSATAELTAEAALDSALSSAAPSSANSPMSIAGGWPSKGSIIIPEPPMSRRSNLVKIQRSRIPVSASPASGSSVSTPTSSSFAMQPHSSAIPPLFTLPSTMSLSSSASSHVSSPSPSPVPFMEEQSDSESLFESSPPRLLHPKHSQPKITPSKSTTHLVEASAVR